MNLSFKLKEYIRHIAVRSPLSRRALRKQLEKPTPGKLEAVVRRAIADCPFYSSYKDLIADGFDLSALPIIRKPDIINCSRSMVSRRVPSFMVMRKRTAGSTGIPLNVYYTPRMVMTMNAIPEYLFSKFCSKPMIGVLRDHTTNDSFSQDGGYRHWLFSPYKLNADTLDDYIREMEARKIDCLHVYPSALCIFARLIRQRYGVSPLTRLKGILASSEIFSREDKELIMEVFPGVKIIDLYGHNEHVCSAYAEDLGHYNFFNGYGYVELIDTGERVNGDHRVCEIVATSLANTVMPFIRYGTFDYAEVDADGNVVAIIGRSSDFIVNRHGAVVPCLFLNRRESTRHVLNRQYYQSAPGKMCIRVVVTPDFNDDDHRMLLEDMHTSFGDSFDCEVKAVDHIERTARGKQKRLVRDFEIKDYQ